MHKLLHRIWGTPVRPLCSDLGGNLQARATVVEAIPVDQNQSSYEQNFPFATADNLKSLFSDVPMNVMSATPTAPFLAQAVSTADAFFQTTGVKKKRSVAKSTKIFSVLPDSDAENRLVDVLRQDDGSLKQGINSGDSLLCLFNPGLSKLPDKCFKVAGAKRVLVLDSSKKSCDHWRKMKSRFVSDYKDVEFNVEQLDFTHFANRTLSDLKRGQPNTFVETLKKYGCESRAADSPSAIVFAGAAPFHKERALFLSLLHHRIQKSTIFEFGSLDFLFYVSASKYMVLDERCPVLYAACSTRRHIYSTFFDVRLAATASLADFSQQTKADKAQYRRTLKKGGVDLTLAYLMHVRSKADNEVPLLRPADDTVRTNAHFEYFNRQLFLSCKSVADFVQNFFAGADAHLAQLDEPQLTLLLRRRAKSLSLPEELLLFNSLRKWSAYESSAFFQEAETHLDSTCYPEL